MNKVYNYADISRMNSLIFDRIYYANVEYNFMFYSGTELLRRDMCEGEHVLDKMVQAVGVFAKLGRIDIVEEFIL